MNKLKMHSPNLTESNIAKLAELFPSCVTEAKDEQGRVKQAIDFDQLRQELSDHIVEGPQERYHLNWPGKREALLAANVPIAKTLRPCRTESVDFDKTKNLFIEGDNLEALKLLQESYLGEVKLIYFDPPYNTGKDFIYRDDFVQSAEEYLQHSNQLDDQGNKLVANSQSNGRLHSDWLSMIYPRVKLARNLLANDGVIFVSIDDNESANMKRVFDELFGEQNFIDTIAVEMSTTSGPKTVNAQQGTIVKNVEYVHIYRKSFEFDEKPHMPLFDSVKSYDTHYSFWLGEEGVLGSLSDKLMADDKVSADIHQYSLAERGRFSINNIDRLLSVSDAAKLFIESNLDKIARMDRPPVSAHGKNTQTGKWEKFRVDHRDYFITTLGNGNLQALMPLSLNYRMSDDYKPNFGRTVIRGDLWKGFYQDMGNVTKEGGIVFSNGKKPVRLIKQLIRWANNSKNGIVLDFFAGSATTADAVLQANAEDDGNRQFILVQLDEAPDPKSQAAKDGCNSIAEISRERIRLAGAHIVKSKGALNQDLDVGFRSFKIDSSNMCDVHYSPGALTQDLLSGNIDNIREGRNSEDLLFQVLLDWGVDLSLPISRQEIDSKVVFFVDGDDKNMALAACFDLNIDEAFVKQLAEYEPLRVVFRDAGFASDSVKINIEQIFAQKSPNTEVKVL